MAPIMIDAALREKLLAAKGTIELQDDAGTVIGQFVPKPVNSIWDEIDAPSDEELDRQLLESLTIHVRGGYGATAYPDSE